MHVHTCCNSREVHASCKELRTGLFLSTLLLLNSAGHWPSASEVAGKRSFVPLFISHLSLPGVAQLIPGRGCESNQSRLRLAARDTRVARGGGGSCLGKPSRFSGTLYSPGQGAFRVVLSKHNSYLSKMKKLPKKSLLVKSWETQVPLQRDKGATKDFGGKKNEKESSTSSCTPVLIWTSDNINLIYIFIYLYAWLFPFQRVLLPKLLQNIQM